MKRDQESCKINTVQQGIERNHEEGRNWNGGNCDV